MGNLSFKKYWDQSWKIEKRNKLTYDFIPYISNIVKGKKTYFEAGCAPGDIMAFFHNDLGMDISGVDFCDEKIIHNCLASYGVKKYKLHNKDFNNFTTEDKFDVVASYGFIEHFDNTELIIKKHLDLVNDNGYVAITLPNFRYFNKLIVSVVNKKLLKMHNLDAMNPELIKDIVSSNKSFKIIYADYYKTCFLSFNPNNPDMIKKTFLKKLFSIAGTFLKFIKMDNIPNRFFSPYIMLIAQKTKP